MDASVQVWLQGKVKEIWLITNDEYGSFERDYQHWLAKIENPHLKGLWILYYGLKKKINLSKQFKATLKLRFRTNLIRDEYD